ncbi:MAG TPA: family 78 glycoside hydrolase catalytic domain [Puia sp.]
MIRFLFFGLFSWVSSGYAQDLKLSNLRCEYKVDPMGIGSPAPKLSWEIASSGRGILQTAYRILVSEDSSSLENNVGSVWDSRKASSDASIQVSFAGGALAPARTYYWKVMVWGNHGDSSRWSKIASWQTGLFTKGDWKGARWIGYEDIADSNRMLPGSKGKKKGPVRDTLPLLRREFIVKGPLKKATAFICGLGQFEMRLNGEKVGDHFLDPGWTRYDKEALYVPFDITSQLRQGENAIGVMLGNGFYYIPKERYRKLTVAFGYPKMIARIFLEYADGTTEDVVSDEHWKTAAGPILFSSEYGGEDYDARREKAGWDKAGFNANGWKAAVHVGGPGALHAQQEEPLKWMEAFKPRSKGRLSSGAWVFDLGQNMSGIPAIEVKGAAGRNVRIIPGELLRGDSVNQSATGKPCYFDYTLKGKGIEKWSPRFMYYGFRYLQVEGAVPEGEPNPHGLPVITGIIGWHTRSALERDGKFSCSNELFRRTDTLIDWAIKSNTASVFTDCPHREKLGWLEEAHLMGSSLRYNYDIVNTYRKIIHDMMGAQAESGLMPEIAPEFTQFDEPFRDSPEWGSSCIIVPWYCYEYYGDKGVLAEAYSMMQRYNAYLVTKAQHHILYQGLGDWFDLGPKSPGVSQLTPPGVTATAIWYYDLTILSKTAGLLGKTQDAAGYEALAAEVKKAFNEEFFNRSTREYATGSQTANAMAVFAGLVEPAYKEAVVDNIVKDLRDRNYALTSGDIGFRYLLKVLADEGRSDVIFSMNSRTDVPGYGYQLAHGATSLTESWQALPYVSNNHFMLGHIMEWFYTGLAGIRAAEGSVGFKDIVFRPEVVGDVSWADGDYHSPYGMISSHWRKEGKRFDWSISVPVNTTATIYLPAPDGAVVTEGWRLLVDRKDQNGQPGSGQDVVVLRREKGRLVLRVGSGNYNFRVVEGSAVSQAKMKEVYEQIKTPYKYGLVMAPADNGKKMDCPSIFRKGDSWYMVYLIFNGRGYETWLAQSADLLHWESTGRLLSFGDSTGWTGGLHGENAGGHWDDNQKAGYVSLQDFTWGGSYALQPYENKYWMSYIGGNVKGYEAGQLSIGIAYTSKDPAVAHEWQRLDRPVLTPRDTNVGWWDNHTLYKSDVIWDKSLKTGHPFIMYYNANGDSVNKKRGAERIGMAVSDDMVHWMRPRKSPLLDHLTGITGDPYIQRIGDVWVMFYFGAFWKGTSGAFNRFACSYDLVNWTDWTGQNLIEPSEPYDEVFAHKSFVVKWKGVVYHFYCAVDKKGQRGIAVATSADLGKSSLNFVRND